MGYPFFSNLNFFKMTKVVYAKKVKKRLKRFVGHQSDRFLRVPKSWRKPRGIDGRVRRRFRDNISMPNIGYGTKKKDRFKARKTGKYTFVVRNEQDLQCMKGQEEVYDVYLAKSLSSKKRRDILEKATEMNIRVLNKDARNKAEEANE